MGRKLRVVPRGGGADAPDSSSDVDYDKLIADMDDVVYSSVSEEEASDPDEAGPSSSRRAEEKSISRRLRRLGVSRGNLLPSSNRHLHSVRPEGSKISDAVRRVYMTL